MNVFVASIPNELERKSNVRMDFKTSFCWRSTNLSNDDIISAYSRSENENGV